MEYGLARLTLGSKDFVSLTQREYEAILHARASLFECLFVEQKFDLVVANYTEFETTLLDSTVQHMVVSYHDYESMQVEVALFNRRLINLLTAGRTYVDQVPRHMSAIGGDESLPVKGIFAAQYDAHIGYRAMSALRNFVQHRGFPVRSATFAAQRVDDDSDFRLRHSVSPHVLLGDLRLDPDFKKTVLAELAAMGDKLDLKYLVRDYLEGLWGAHSEFRRLIGLKTTGWETILRDAIQRFDAQSTDAGSSLSVVRRDDGRVLEKTAIFMEFVDLRIHLERRNDTLVNLTRRYASSEIVD